MNKKVFFANSVNKKVIDVIDIFKKNGYKIISKNAFDFCDFKFEEFLKEKCEIKIISDFEKRLILINCAQNLGIKISKSILDKSLNKVKTQNFEINDESKMARYFLKEVAERKMIDFDGNFDVILAEVLRKIDEEKILFIGIDFEEKVLFDFFKNLLKNDNHAFIFLKENNDYFKKNDCVINFCNKNNIFVSFLDEEKTDLNILEACFSSNIELCDFFLNFSNKKIGIISSEKSSLNFFYNFFTQSGFKTRYIQDKNEPECLSEMFIKTVNEKLDFSSSFSRFLLRLFDKDNEKLNKVKLFFRNLNLQGLCFLQETIDFAYIFFKNDEEVLKYIDGISYFFNEKKCDFLINFCRKNLDKNFLNFINFKIENIDEILDILSFLRSKKNDDNFDRKCKSEAIFLGSVDDAVLFNFDYIFFVNLTQQFFEKRSFFNKISIIINSSKNAYFLHKNDQHFLSISSFLSIKKSIKFKKQELNFEKKQDNDCVKKISSPLVKIEDLSQNFSYKKLTTYMENPYLFFTKYVLCLYEENFASETLSLKGRIFHEIFSICVKNKNILHRDFDEIKSFIFDNLSVNIFDDFLKMDIDFELDDFLAFLIKICDKKINEKSAIISEESFYCNVTINGLEIRVVAKPDLIIKNEDGFCEIFDLKTSESGDPSKAINDELLMKSPQMLMYAWVLKKNGIKVSNFSYIFFNKKGSEIVDLLNDKCEQVLDEKIDEFEDFFTKILSKIYKQEGVVFDYEGKSIYNEILYLSKYN